MKSIQQFVCVTFAGVALALTATGSVHGQGKLGRVRKAVREEKIKDQPKPGKKLKEIKPHRDKETDHRRDRKRDRRFGSNHRSHRPHRNRSSDLSFGTIWFSQPEPVHVIHHHVPPAAPAPVVVAAPQPAYETVVEETLEAPTPSPTSTTSESYFEYDADFDWAVRLSATGGTDFTDISHGSLGLLIQPKGGFGIDTSVTMFRESGINVRDHLYLGDVNLTYEPGMVPDHFRLRIGAGVNWLGDSFGGDAGFNMTGGLDWKLTDRWLVTGEVDFGTIGDTDLTHAQISLGRALGEQTELTFGYNYHDIGGVTIGSAFTGLRFRF